MTIKEIMKDKGISMYRLSKNTGIPYATLNDICNGRARLEKCTAETVYRIANELDITVGALLDPILYPRIEFETFLREQIEKIAGKYSIKKVALFGSRATGTNTEESDVDLIVEFSKDVSLLTLSGLKNELEELLNLNVDIIHGPIKNTDMIKIRKVVEIYAA